MTATENPPNKTIQEWINVFLAQGTESYTSSVTFMKQLTVVAISTITYMKNVFPEDSYTVANFGGLKLKILKKKCNDELAQFLSTALLQAFEAFEKKYLHQLVLCFYEDECQPENLIEYHIFEFSYNKTGVSMNIHSKSRNNENKNVKCTFEDVKQQTTRLLRACIILMQSCPEGLPSTFDISLRLYYNDDAPEGYQAPGYGYCSSPKDHLEPTIEQIMRLGWVESAHHKLIASSYIKDVFQPDASPSQNPPAALSLTQRQYSASTVKLNSIDGIEVVLRCPCNKYDADNYPTPKIITCQYCNESQHAACFGILIVDEHKSHCCERCYDEDNTRPKADPELLPLSAKNRECLCIFRRTLEWCCELTAIGGAQIADRFNLSASNAIKLIKLLHSFNIVELNNDTDSMSSMKINHDHLKQTMTKFFKNNQESLADRLLAETLGSQDSVKSDPIGDVLSPMEKVTLQHTSTIGRVIPNDVAKPKKVDSTMKQYQEALFSTDDNNLDELPLSGAHNPVKDVEKMIKVPEKKGVKRKDISDNTKTLKVGVKNKKARISSD